MKLIVLSDLHLGRSGTDNGARLDAAIERIETAYADADLVAIAGDLLDRDRGSTYEDLRDRLEQLTPPVVATVGNHDERTEFARNFPEFCDDAGFAQSQRDVAGHSVILLDTVAAGPTPGGRPNHSYGEFCSKRLAWLEAALTKTGGRPVVVITHHPVLPLRLKSDSLDLRNPLPLLDRLERHHNIRQVLSGHVHLTCTNIRRGVAYTTLAGGDTTCGEMFGRQTGKQRRSGPAQMAVVLSDPDQTLVHFDNYMDANPEVARRE